MTMLSLGYIKFRTHTVSITQDTATAHIYCFKHTATRCELESFVDQDMAAEYIVTPMQDLTYRLELNEPDS